MLRCIAIFSCLVAGISAECPNINDLPVLNDAGDKFYCAVTWGDTNPWDQSIPLEGCNHYNDYYPHSLMDGDDKTTTGGGTFYSLGSLIVKAGCTLYGYEVGNKCEF